MAQREIGTVIASRNGPTVNHFSFVLKETNQKAIPIQKGQFVQLNSMGILVATVEDIIKTNRYFDHAEAVSEYERGGLPLSAIFPADRWEYIIAFAKPLGILHQDNLTRVSFPPSPGDKVYFVDDSILFKLLRLDSKGISLGKICYHENIPASFNLTKLFQKHIAILAMSGAGKSYTTSVLIEELLNRQKEHGRLGIVILDVHGEYTSFAEKNDGGADFSDRATVIRSSYFSLNTTLLTAGQIAEMIPQMSQIQVRELTQILAELRKANSHTAYSLRDLLSEIEAKENINTKTRDILLSWLYELQSLHLFEDYENPKLEEAVKPGHALIIDLSETTRLRKKQIIITYLARRLFNLRKRNLISPFVFVLEEAHQFCPESARRSAISRSIIETYAREGRKFGASLLVLSQRPVHLSTTVLSQCGTHLIGKVTNPYDLDHIKKSSEQITKETIDLISNLPTGEILIVGAATKFPVFIKVRERLSKSPNFLELEEAAINFEKSL
ncbi:MAG: ATP-binding protein [Candidatus Helarchaeota archaeon]|nr:ATP-binding protein [Candidatus Helarchaeota archaeon]